MSQDIDSALLESLPYYRLAVSDLPDVEVKGATVPYTSLYGHMFSYWMKSGSLALRLPASAIPGFLETYKTTLCSQYGVVQKEYVVVPNELLKQTDTMRDLFSTSYAYVSALKPKPTARKKK